MGDTIEIVQGTATTIEIAGLQGPQGPQGATGATGATGAQGPAGTGIETLTTKGDLLYRDTSVAARLPIGTSGQILKVAASGIPEWGAAPASGVTSVAGRTGDVTLAKGDVGLGNVDNTSDASKPVSTATQTALNTKANSSHTHSVSDLTQSGAEIDYILTWDGAWLPTEPTVVRGIIGAAPASTTVGAGTGLTGGGDLTANRTLAVSYGSSAGTACEGNDARLSDARTPSSTLAHKASHATGGTDALAPSDIGAQSLFTSEAITLSGDTTLSAARAKIWTINNFSTSTRTLTLPTSPVEGDVAIIRGQTLLGNVDVVSGSTLATLETGAVPQRYRFVYTTSWALDPVPTHTHFASQIVSGTLLHERGGLEADVSAYNGLVKIASGSTSAVTVTSAGEALLDDADAAAQRTTLGLGNSATLNTGTTAGTVAAGDHTHTQLHDRSHAITSASDHTAGSNKIFYSDNTGAITELALGANGTVLTSSGATSAPTFSTPAASGITAVGASTADVLSVSGSDLVADDPNADRIVFWDDSESKWRYLEAGSGLSISGTTMTATASGGSKTYSVFTAEHNQPPASNFATLDTRNSIAVLDFDDATDESAVFMGIIPEGASLGSGLKIRLHWAATTATSGDVRFDVQLERMTTDLDSDSFDTVASSTATTSGTSGILTVTEITLTTIDSVTAGDGFRLKVTRDANNAADTMSGDCELYICEVRSAA